MAAMSQDEFEKSIAYLGEIFNAVNETNLKRQGRTKTC